MDPLNDESGLKVGFWNINGLPEEKSEEDFFLKQLQLCDIIFLSETWHRENSADKMFGSHGCLYGNVYRKIKNGKEENLEGFWSTIKNNLKIS